MAGHFVVWRISLSDKDWVLANVAGSRWTATEHAANAPLPHGGVGVFPGWTDLTRAALHTARHNVVPALQNRQNLPPHKYLAFNAAALSDLQKLDIRKHCEFLANLERPRDAGFGVAALCMAAQNLWSTGDRTGALFAQIAHGDTSIEVYYLGKKEIS